MDFDQLDFNFADGLMYWLKVFGTTSLVAFLTGLVVSFVVAGSRGLGLFLQIVGEGIRDLLLMSPRRVYALAQLTIRETVRNKVLLVGAVFLVLFMFAGWFLQGETEDRPAKPYVAFVLTSLVWVLVPTSLLLACWGLPSDIKARAVHTVVTKPVRRSEIVLGRILGYFSVVSFILVVMGVVGYFWIIREVPETSRNQLVSRVPIYSKRKVEFLTREGAAGQGVNTGDIWKFREFIEGSTNARALYTFEGLDVKAIEASGGLRFEHRFEAFRTYKADIGEEVRFSMQLINPATRLRARVGNTHYVREFTPDAEDVKNSAGELIREAPVVDGSKLRRVVDDELSEEAEKPVTLSELVDDKGTLVVEIACVDGQQYLGAAQPDLFIRLPNKSFATGYFKCMFGIWMRLFLIIMLGTTGSTFLKFPVCTFLTFFFVLAGGGLRGVMNEILTQYTTEGKVLGGGVLESVYRIFTQMNQSSPLPDNFGTRVIQRYIDPALFDMLNVSKYVLPDFTPFSRMSLYVANGFDVPWAGSFVPCLASTLSYFVPCMILGYFSLRLRELEAK